MLSASQLSFTLFKKLPGFFVKITKRTLVPLAINDLTYETHSQAGFKMHTSDKFEFLTMRVSQWENFIKCLSTSSFGDPSTFDEQPDQDLTYNNDIQYKYKMVPLKWEYSIASYVEFISTSIHKWYRWPKSICSK